MIRPYSSLVSTASVLMVQRRKCLFVMCVVYCVGSDHSLNVARVALLKSYVSFFELKAINMSGRVFCELVCQGWEGREKFYHSRCRATGARIPIPSDQQTLSPTTIIIIIHLSYCYHTTSNSYSQICPQINSLPLVGHSDHLGPGHLCHLLLFLKVKESKEVGDPRIGRDVRLPTKVSVSKGWLQINCLQILLSC